MTRGMVSHEVSSIHTLLFRDNILLCLGHLLAFLSVSLNVALLTIVSELECLFFEQNSICTHAVLNLFSPVLIPTLPLCCINVSVCEVRHQSIYPFTEADIRPCVYIHSKSLPVTVMMFCAALRDCQRAYPS